jgi:hypothetical protein
VSANDPGSPRLADDFVCDKDRGKAPSAREQRHPELHESVSAYRSLADARRLWSQIADRVGAERVRLGPYVARVRLAPGLGVKYELNADPTGHIYVNGRPLKLASAVVEIVHVVEDRQTL